MNISDTAAAMATANELSGVAPPSSWTCLTRSGELTELSTSSDRSRFSRASRAKRMTWSIWARAGEPRGRSAFARSRICSERSRPSTSNWRPRKLYSPPVPIRFRKSSATWDSSLVSALFASWT